LRLFRTESIKKTPVLKREELYQGLIEPGWGAGLSNPAQGGERDILYVTPLTLNSFLYVFLQEYLGAIDKGPHDFGTFVRFDRYFLTPPQSFPALETDSAGERSP
jgi:hypothetical protein